jgi:hypothetical protein
VDVKEAVKRAKAYVQELFGDDLIGPAGLEEIEKDDSTGDWLITLSLARMNRGALPSFGPDFKVVAVREDGEIRAMKHRYFADG